MRSLDFYGEPALFEARDVCLTSDEAGLLIALMRELRDLTQSRATYKAASALIEHLTGEHEDINLIEPDVLTQ